MSRAKEDYYSIQYVNEEYEQTDDSNLQEFSLESEDSFNQIHEEN